MTVAREWGFVPPTFSGGKRKLRDFIRRSRRGDAGWQLLQAEVYAERIAAAPPFPGAREFIAHARDAGASVSIVSHKTRFATGREGGVDLRAAALRWLRANAFVGAGAVWEDDVYFESTRAEKLNRIRLLQADIAIDDLVEVLTDPAFPPGVRRWLFAPDTPPSEAARLECFADWAAMRAAFEA